MTDTLDRLKAALADRYAIEREIGSGGMATVAVPGKKAASSSSNFRRHQGDAHEGQR